MPESCCWATVSWSVGGSCSSGELARLAERDAGDFLPGPPNAHSVYPEDLPDEVPPLAPIRPITQLDRPSRGALTLSGHVSPGRAGAAKREGQLVYPKTNSHWSSLGAFVAYRVLAAVMATMVKLNRLESEDVRFDEDVQSATSGSRWTPRRPRPGCRRRSSGHGRAWSPTTRCWAPGRS